MLAHHSPFLQTSLRGAAPHYHPQKPHSVTRKKHIHSWPWCFPLSVQWKESQSMKASHLLFFFLLSQRSLPDFNFHLSFPTHFSKKGERKRRREGARANESGTLACDNCHAEWTSPLFIGFWNSIHCLGRQVIKERGNTDALIMPAQWKELFFPLLQMPPFVVGYVCCARIATSE